MIETTYPYDRAAVDDFDIAVPGGHLRAHRFGPANGPLVICVPGISANSRWFDFLAERLSAGGRQVVALDLRGRGYSSTTPPGTYGWRNHALDVYAVARALGASSFDYVGHSMGAYVGMEAGVMRDDVRIDKLVLIDGLGVPRLAAVMAIVRVLGRLDRDYDSCESYVGSIRNLGLVQHWNAYWERAYEYELKEEAGRVRSRTHRAPVFEDIEYGYRHDARLLWPKLQMPVLALRATIPIVGRTGFIVPACDLQNFARIAPRATVAEIH
ncbi:MAG: alpha/beta hydrolase, partial [Candidatus Eremiobacteraeota bacterium]|nr:alpha/beta hydrolase [Candidatus Eremiobacteraeota bacterium]